MTQHTRTPCEQIFFSSASSLSTLSLFVWHDSIPFIRQVVNAIQFDMNTYYSRVYVRIRNPLHSYIYVYIQFHFRLQHKCARARAFNSSSLAARSLIGFIHCLCITRTCALYVLPTSSIRIFVFFFYCKLQWL